MRKRDEDSQMHVLITTHRNLTKKCNNWVSVCKGKLHYYQPVLRIRTSETQNNAISIRSNKFKTIHRVLRKGTGKMRRSWTRWLPAGFWPVIGQSIAPGNCQVEFVWDSIAWLRGQMLDNWCWMWSPTMNLSNSLVNPCHASQSNKPKIRTQVDPISLVGDTKTFRLELTWASQTSCGLAWSTHSDWLQVYKIHNWMGHPMSDTEVLTITWFALHSWVKNGSRKWTNKIRGCSPEVNLISTLHTLMK